MIRTGFQYRVWSACATESHVRSRNSPSSMTFFSLSFSLFFFSLSLSCVCLYALVHVSGSRVGRLTLQSFLGSP